ncbi:hypothetical protein [Kurthia sibirica]|uniref:hypothetical protein n=1 Tax=Kurthia sibirica TaxID=202750 RepID=UPI0011B299CC|nr:hypothetical protein [Kurthia sibirica]
MIGIASSKFDYSLDRDNILRYHAIFSALVMLIILFKSNNFNLYRCYLPVGLIYLPVDLFYLPVDLIYLPVGLFYLPVGPASLNYSLDRGDILRYHVICWRE